MNYPILSELCDRYDLQDSPKDFEYIEVNSDYVSPNTVVYDGTTYKVEYVGNRDILEYDYYDNTLNFGFQVYGKPKKIEVKGEHLFQTEEPDRKFLLSELVGVMNYKIKETDLINDSKLIIYRNRFVFNSAALKEFVEVALLLNNQKNITVNYDAFNKTFYIETEEWNCFISEYIYVRNGLNCINVKRTDIRKSLNIYEFTADFDTYEQNVKKTIKAKHGKVDLFAFTYQYSSRPILQCLLVSKDNTVKIATNSYTLVCNIDPRQTNIPTKKKEYQLLRKDGATGGGVEYFPNTIKFIYTNCKEDIISIDQTEFIADIQYFNQKIKEVRTCKKRLDISDVHFVTSDNIVLHYNRIKEMSLFMKNGIKSVEFNAKGMYFILTDEIGGLSFNMSISKNCKKRDNTTKWLEALKNDKKFNKQVIVRRN